MDRDIELKIETLKHDILDEPLIKKYLIIKNLYNSSSKISTLKKRLAKLQKCSVSEEEKEEYYKLMKEYNEDSLVIEFKNISDEVCDFLEEIKKELEL
jgi:cell fate (sporulation/competence/biofilm development) regulator YmcA (YheA/YmcA/DUF963 family)